MSKTAVVLFNLGGPDSKEAVFPFLRNLFNDPAIIGLPTIFRHPLSWVIAKKRTPTAQEIYSHLGDRSPILPETEAQADALNKELGKDYKLFIAMRYWHPFTEETVAEVQAWNPDQVILLPLYPQCSVATSVSSVEAWHKTAKAAGLTCPHRLIGCYPTEPGWIEAVVQLIKDKAPGPLSDYRLLFSAHGVPEKYIKDGDPYQAQVESTVAAVTEALPEKGLDIITCYQSKVGPLAWIGPSTEDEIERAGREQKKILLIPIAFVSEHSETLVELDIEYKELADEHNVPDYIRIPTVSAHKTFIKGLASLIKQVETQDTPCLPTPPLCAADRTKCLCRRYSEMLNPS